MLAAHLHVVQVGLLVAGYDQTGPHLFNTDPSGNYCEPLGAVPLKIYFILFWASPWPLHLTRLYRVRKFLAPCLATRPKRAARSLTPCQCLPCADEYKAMAIGARSQVRCVPGQQAGAGTIANK